MTNSWLVTLIFQQIILSVKKNKRKTKIIIGFGNAIVFLNLATLKNNVEMQSHPRYSIVDTFLLIMQLHPYFIGIFLW